MERRTLAEVQYRVRGCSVLPLLVPGLFPASCLRVESLQRACSYSPFALYDASSGTMCFMLAAVLSGCQHTCTRMRVFVCVCVSRSLSVSLSVCVRACLCVCVCVCLCVCVWQPLGVLAQVTCFELQWNVLLLSHPLAFYSDQ